MPIAVIPKPYPGAHRHLSLEQQLLRELNRPQLPVLLRNPRPRKHRRLRHFNWPAKFVQTRYQHVTPTLVVLYNLMHTILRPLQRRDRRHLDRRECPIVEVALDPRQRRNELLITYHEADTPPWHVVALRQCEELYRNILRARDPHRARSLVPIN